MFWRESSPDDGFLQPEGAVNPFLLGAGDLSSSSDGGVREDQGITNAIPFIAPSSLLAIVAQCLSRVQGSLVELSQLRESSSSSPSS